MRSGTRRCIFRLSAALPLGLFLAGIAAGPALGVDGVIVEETTVTATQDGDTITAKVKLTNLGPLPITLVESKEIKEGCLARVTNRDLELLQTTTVSIQFDGSCFPAQSSLINLDLDGNQNLVPAITVNPPETKPSDWAAAKAGVPWGIGFAVVVLIVGVVAKLTADNVITSGVAKRNEEYKEVKEVVGARIEIADEKLRWRAALPPLKYPWLRGSVRNLEAGWSLTGSFVSNLTLGTTALVALVTSVDAATAILGAAPKEAFRVMVTVGLVSAVLIAIANLIVKVLGPSATDVTPIGLIVATSIVVGAATLQTVTVGALAAGLVAPPAETVPNPGWWPQAPAQWIAWVATALVVAALGLYGSTAVWRWIGDGKPTNVPTIPADALTAWNGSKAWQNTLLKRDLQKAFKEWLEPVPEHPETDEEREARETSELTSPDLERSTRTAAQKLSLATGEPLQRALL